MRTHYPIQSAPSPTESPAEQWERLTESQSATPRSHATKVALAGPGSWPNDTKDEPASVVAKAKPPGGFGKRQPEGVISLGYRFMAALARRKKWANPQKAALKDLITSERLEPYRKATVTKTDEAALGLHLWNVDLSSALYADIASVEIFLRNAIDQQLRELFNKPQWYPDSSGGFIPEIGDRAISGLQTAQRWLGRNQPLSLAQGTSSNAVTCEGRTTAKSRRSKVAMVEMPRRSAIATTDASTKPRPRSAYWRMSATART